jgi:hypothetical protein
MHGTLAYRSCCGIPALVAAALILNTALPARAGIIVSVESVTANQGSTGNTLEVDVLNTGTPVDIASFSFEISVAAGSGVSFTGADINTVANIYIFAGNSLFGPNIATITGTTLLASDAATSGSTTLGTNSTLALGRAFFDVASSAPVGPVTVSFTPFPSTSLTDPNVNDIPIDTLNSGTITIASTIIPEPSALVSATAGLLASAWFVLRKRRSGA